MTEQEELSDELIRLAADVAYFAYRKCGFRCDAQQRNIFRRSNKRVILNCSRQTGKSTTAALIAVHTAVLQPASTIVVTAPTKQQIREFMRKVRDFACVASASSRGGRFFVEFKNGSRIIGIAANEDNVRGFSAVTLLIIDEASRVKDEVYFALLPMLAVSNGALWLLSTPKGQRGFFHAEWADATNGTIDGTLSTDNWVKIRVTAHDCERIEKKFLQLQKIRLDERRFAQEYECTFVDTKHNIFHPEATRNAFRDDIKPFDA